MSENKTNFSTALTKISNTYFPMIEEQLTGNGINMDDYAKNCVMNAISSINRTLDEKGIAWNDPQLDHSNVTEILLSVASLKLNPSASPREVYFQTRNVKRKENNKEVWKKQIELGIEGDGNDAILARFGRDVKQVMQYWLVRENDDFKYPTYNGLEMEPPVWTPKGSGKVVRVVYPIIKTNDVVEYHIAEREDVVRNLIAHVNNNLMNETFGIAESRYKATAKQKEQIQQKKDEIIGRIEDLGLDGALDDEVVRKYISPAWKDPHSRESMITRKMRNNIVKRIPKDFGNALVEMTYDEVSDDSTGRARKEVENYANGEIIDFEPTPDPPKQANPEPDPRPTETIQPEEEPKQEKPADPQAALDNLAKDEVPF